jgi:hypothetical protein
MYSRFLLIFVLLIFTASRGGKGTQVGIPPDCPNDSIGQSAEIFTGEMNIAEMGTIKQVGDSGYPFGTITIDFPERDFSETFIIN